jgi:hypothetical protein
VIDIGKFSEDDGGGTGSIGGGPGVGDGGTSDVEGSGSF